MHTYVALLRGINVGGNNKVEMSKLKNVCEALGFSNVSTYINSGNVVFQTKKVEPAALAEKIERALEKSFGFAIRVVVRDAKNIQNICDAIPKQWVNDADMKTDIIFLWEEFDTKDTLKVIKNNPRVDTLKYIDGAIVWKVDRKHYTKSGMHDFIGTEVYKHMTARNVNTVRKLAELAKNIGAEKKGKRN